MSNADNSPPAISPGQRPQSRKTTGIDKALTVLEILGDAEKPLRLTEIARRAQFAKSTTHRLLHELVAHRMASGIKGSYVLGDRVVDSLRPTSEREIQSLKTILMPYLIDLYDLTHGAIYLGVLGDNGGIVSYLVSLFGHNAVATPSRGRDWAPAHCTAIGKVLLADQPTSSPARRPEPRPAAGSATGAPVPAGFSDELTAVRRVGFAQNRGEYVRSVACVAVGVVDSLGDTCAAIAVSDHIERLNPTQAIHHLRRIGFASSVAMRNASRGRVAAIRRTMPPTSGPGPRIAPSFTAR